MSTKNSQTPHGGARQRELHLLRVAFEANLKRMERRFGAFDERVIDLKTALEMSGHRAPAAAKTRDAAHSLKEKFSKSPPKKSATLLPFPARKWD